MCTRIKWVLNELKENRIVANDLYIDSRMFAIRSAKHVFELLWKLVCHDIYFLWERIYFLTNQNDKILIKYPFTVNFNSNFVSKKKKEKKLTFFYNFKVDSCLETKNR
jgi:hypothetical protein